LFYDATASIAALQPWDVIYPFDNQVRPEKHKMWACVSRTDLWFMRINTRRNRASCVALSQARHPFLRYDSFLGCEGDLISVSEAELEMLLGRQADAVKQGIVGSIHATERNAVCNALRGSRVFAPSQLRIMFRELACT